MQYVDFYFEFILNTVWCESPTTVQCRRALAPSETVTCVDDHNYLFDYHYLQIFLIEIIIIIIKPFLREKTLIEWSVGQKLTTEAEELARISVFMSLDKFSYKCNRYISLFGTNHMYVWCKIEFGEKMLIDDWIFCPLGIIEIN